MPSGPMVIDAVTDAVVLLLIIAQTEAAVHSAIDCPVFHQDAFKAYAVHLAEKKVMSEF